ncbi:MAG: type II toxin-antitoxin system VapC family toxin [Verrucomicrobia bacterium]|nr:type II toxin-antitoxin system VapC family toxin [Verrucomicrobiota bacterium]
MSALSQRVANDTPIPANATWIAALARQHGLPVLSNDPHFDAVPGTQRIAFPEAL